MRGFYSPIDRAAEQLPRTKGTGAEFMTELSKRPGYKQQEAQDRGLQALLNLPKMERAEFLKALKAKQATRLSSDSLDDDDEGEDRTKYGEYTLPGGDNYREILMRMPFGARTTTASNDPGEDHWDVPGVLAHVRVKDRRGPKGEKILHIEEIQSDLHQAGREHGYETPGLRDQYKASQRAYREARDRLAESKLNAKTAEYGLKSDMPLYQDPEVRQRLTEASAGHNNDIMERTPQVMRAAAAMQDLEHKINSVVPDAPFKTNWHELALKKMIHEAARDGYDSIAITPGAEQADRYKLSKKVGTVSYHPESQNFKAHSPEGKIIIDENGATPERVAALVGKDVSARLMQSPQAFGRHMLEGEDLNIGGEGMTGFYDKIVPNFLNAFGKKYGARVSPSQLDLNQTMVPAFRPGFGQRNMVPSIKGGRSQFEPVHSFPITPEMREDVVKNGVPLYAEGGAVEQPKYKVLPFYDENNKRVGWALHEGDYTHDVYPTKAYANSVMQRFLKQDALPIAPKKAKGGDVSRETTKPIGYTKVTAAPDLDQMNHALMGVKHYRKKAK